MRDLIEPDHASISVSRQCQLLGLSRSSLYYEPVGANELNLELMRLIDEQYTRTPFFGSPQMTRWLRARGHAVNPKRIVRLMRMMRLCAIYPKPRPHGSTVIRHPYLLRGLTITRPNQVWATDITYIRLRRGWVYLVAVMDWFSRYVLTWELSGSLEADFCLRALDRSFEIGTPDIFNSDQGVQFTCLDFTGRLQAKGIAISMNGQGRALDNRMVERLWRTVKYEEVYLKDYANLDEATESLRAYFQFYNRERPHSSLDGRTPEAVYFAAGARCTA